MRALAGAAFAAALLFVGLGIWQFDRLGWKRALIAQVDARLALPPVAAPGPGRWDAIGPDDAYTRLRVTGRYRTDADTFVQAATELGGGYWVLTPLTTDEGWTVLVNRGFVPTMERRRLPPPPSGTAAIEGLLRLSEPGGGFLRTNDPAGDRWFSRDVAAIARRRALPRAAPYFIDAAAPGTGWPRGGLTVVRFRNNHLVYALTWFALAALSVWSAVLALRERARQRSG